MRKTIRIDGISIHPKNKDGKEYAGNKYSTSDGDYSSFDNIRDGTPCNEKLVAMRGKWVDVEIKIDGNYKNIVGYYGEGTQEVEQPTVDNQVINETKLATPPEFPFSASTKQSSRGHLYIGEVKSKGKTKEECLDNLKWMTNEMIVGFKDYNEKLGGNNNVSNE